MGLFGSTLGRCSTFLPTEITLDLSKPQTGETAIHNPVIDAVRTGSALKLDFNHSFPDIVDNYVGYAHKFDLVGGDGKGRELYQLRGSLNGVEGIFEWIVDPDPALGVTHRRFIANGKITGKPNQNPRKAK